MIERNDITRRYPETFTECFDFSPPKGWLNIVEDLTKKANELGVKVVQVKQKLGGLKFYMENPPKDLQELAWKEEERSFGLCEECGTDKEVGRRARKDSGYIRTLCKDCRVVDDIKD